MFKMFSPGISVYDFALSIGCFKWDRDALRIIAGGGFYINQVTTGVYWLSGSGHSMTT